MRNTSLVAAAICMMDGFGIDNRPAERVDLRPYAPNAFGSDYVSSTKRNALKARAKRKAAKISQRKNRSK